MRPARVRGLELAEQLAPAVLVPRDGGRAEAERGGRLAMEEARVGGARWRRHVMCVLMTHTAMRIVMLNALRELRDCGAGTFAISLPPTTAAASSPPIVG